MNIRSLRLGVGCALLALGFSALAFAQDRPAVLADQKQSPMVGDLKLSGPYAHENLTIFLLHGEDRVKDKDFLTLQEAIEQKKMIVHETENVNELAVENVSPSQEIFIQSGDLVKGGKQDRLLVFDLIVQPKSGRLPVAAFCVEAGRWQQRGLESRAVFGTSLTQAAGKDLKLAAKPPARVGEVHLAGGLVSGRPAYGGFSGIQGGQPGVWKEVDALQRKLKRSLSSEVQADESKSSLQLTLENKKLQETASQYSKKLSAILDSHKDAIGFAFAINGKFNSAEVYSSHTLFKKLWPKLLTASAVEAIAELSKDKKFEPATAESVKACLLDAEKGKASSQELTKRIKVYTLETDNNILFETCDKEQKGQWIHRSYLSKK
jgi:hypothetical protein